jgi:tRNA G18 (ribose-2'-O)-methylase SpoU
MAGVTVTRIEDERDDRLADYRNVPDPELLADRRLFVAEGRLVVRRLLTASRFAVRSVLVTDIALASLGDALSGRPGVPVFVVPQRVMDAVIGFNVHRGCLALGERRPARTWEDATHGARTLAILERMGNPDNVGGVFRNAAAFGVDAVLIGPSCADPLYRKAIRTSMGAALTVPFAAAAPWPDMIGALREEGWLVVGLVTSRDTPALREAIAGSAGARIAVVIGHEGDGLTAGAIGACDVRAHIPMTEDVDSLNAATAAAIAFYEMARA